MENKTSAAPQTSKAKIWTGRIISILCILFLLFDAGGKIFKESHSVEGTIALGFAESLVPVFGTILLACTILYIIPRTAIIGAVLITGYLGGAIVTMMRAAMPVYFALAIGILVWLGLYLRDNRVRVLFSSN